MTALFSKDVLDPRIVQIIYESLLEIGLATDNLVAARETIVTMAHARVEPLLLRNIDEKTLNNILVSMDNILEAKQKTGLEKLKEYDPENLIGAYRKIFPLFYSAAAGNELTKDDWMALNSSVGRV